MSFKEFRYLEKYIGKYRVRAPLDEDTQNFPLTEDGFLDPSFDDLYIRCKRGGRIVHSYRRLTGDAILAWYYEGAKKGNRVVAEIREKYSEKELWLEVDDECGSDFLMYFKDSDFSKIAPFLKPETYGASIRPYSKKNVPKANNIPEEDLERLRAITNKLGTRKMIFIKQCVEEFDDLIPVNKGKKYNPTRERAKSGLRGKEFIYAIGLWEEFLQFCEQKAKEINGV